MDPETQVEGIPDDSFCPQCGSKESGYFCRKCGTLLQGEEMVLCPRCHHIVPDGEFCNQCGQSLSGIALNLRQLALAGDDFWVTAGAASPSTTPPASVEPSLLEPDESVVLASAELPGWLQELPAESVPAEMRAHVYPALEPMARDREGARQRRFLILVIILAALILFSLVYLVLFVLWRSGG